MCIYIYTHMYIYICTLGTLGLEVAVDSLRTWRFSIVCTTSSSPSVWEFWHSPGPPKVSKLLAFGLLLGATRPARVPAMELLGLMQGALTTTHIRKDGAQHGQQLGWVPAGTLTN